MPEFIITTYQVGSFVTTAVLSISLLTAHFLQDGSPQRYEVSRWLTTAAMLIYTLHYALQLTLGLRLMGVDVGALANILLYAPSGYLLSYAQLRLETAGRNLRRFAIIEAAAYVLIVALIAIGIVLHGSLHIGGWLYAADFVYFLSILLAFGMPAIELRRIRKRLDRELGEPAGNYMLCMKFGSLLMLFFAATSPFYIFRAEVMAVLAPLAMASMVIYVISFIVLGFRMHSITEVIEDESSPLQTSPRGRENNGDEKTCSAEGRLQAMNADTNTIANPHGQTEQAIAYWRSHRGYRDSELTLLSFCRQTNLAKDAFTQYLQQHEGTTFRVWLSNIRMEEAKRMLREHPDYSNDVIATECGFSSRVYFQRLFKASTGMTPVEWKRQG